MSKLFQRIVIQALTKLGTESTALQRAAQKAARAQHNFSTNKLTPASEKAGVWLGAAAREVYLDIQAATAYLKSGPPNAEGEMKETPPKSGQAAASTSSTSKGSTSGQRHPFQ